MVLYEQAKAVARGSRPSPGGYAPVSTGADIDDVPMTPITDQMEDDNATLVGDNPDSPRNMMSRDKFSKLNRSDATLAHKPMVDLNDDINFGRKWGFWEIIALKPVQNMLASLFLIS